MFTEPIEDILRNENLKLQAALAERDEQIRKLREVGQAMCDHLLESAGDEILVRIDIPDEIWFPFVNILKGD